MVCPHETLVLLAFLCVDQMVGMIGADIVQLNVLHPRPDAPHSSRWPPAYTDGQYIDSFFRNCRSALKEHAEAVGYPMDLAGVIAEYVERCAPVELR